HLLVGQSEIAAASVEQLAVGHASGHDHGVEILLDIMQRDLALACGGQQALVVIDRPSDGHARLAYSKPARTVGKPRTGGNLRSQATLTCEPIMSTKSIPLGTQEHEILRAIARTAKTASAVPLSSTQRLRFEMLGLIEDRADGIRLTERGRAIAAA